MNWFRNCIAFPWIVQPIFSWFECLILSSIGRFRNQIERPFKIRVWENPLLRNWLCTLRMAESTTLKLKSRVPCWLVVKCTWTCLTRTENIPSQFCFRLTFANNGLMLLFKQHYHLIFYKKNHYYILLLTTLLFFLGRFAFAKWPQSIS